MRYSTVELPFSKYVPGVNEPPKRHFPESFHALERVPIDADNWKGNGLYLYGIDLFNYGFYWECHVALEDLWHLANRHRSKEGLFLQAIIQYAAGLLKKNSGQIDSSIRLQNAACEKLGKYAEPYFFGIELAALRKGNLSAPVSELILEGV